MGDFDRRIKRIKRTSFRKVFLIESESLKVCGDFGVTLCGYFGVISLLISFFDLL